MFQNRYKSILCQEDAYLRELVRYIHLNPLRARLVKDLKGLDTYPFIGHSVLMGRKKLDWQDTDYVLKRYGTQKTAARKGYREYVEKGIFDGRRPDLVGGGLMRSAGGWSVVKAMRRGMERKKGNERILGDGNFVASALQAARENLESQYELKSKGYGFDWRAGRVALLMNLEPAGKYLQRVKARSLLCYWGAGNSG